MTLLKVNDLRTHFSTGSSGRSKSAKEEGKGMVRAVDGVSFEVHAGEVLCLVGESGSGKSVTSMSIMGLIPAPPGKIVGGEVLFDDGDGAVDLLKASKGDLRRLRGSRLAMIFQDPMTSLNPYLRVERQLTEVLELHQGMSRADARQRSIAMLAEVGIPDPEARIDAYPHELSGGMRQRVMIAMALLCQPKLLIADEPTTALDVTIQAQILDLLNERRQKLDLGVLLITHDLGVVATMADRVAVMYAGRIVEQGHVDTVFSSPQHPYTQALLRSIPRLDIDDTVQNDHEEAGAGRRRRLFAIEGMPPLPGALPQGCAFHPRCDQVVDACTELVPVETLLRIDGRPHTSRCHLAVGSGAVETASESTA